MIKFFILLLIPLLAFTGCSSKDVSQKQESGTGGKEKTAQVYPSYCRVKFKVIDTYPEEKYTINLVLELIECGSGASVIKAKDSIKIYFPYSLNPPSEYNLPQVSAGDTLLGDIIKSYEKTFAINYYKKLKELK